MRKPTLAALIGAFALALPSMPATASDESLEAREAAASAVDRAKADMLATFGKASLERGQHLWAKGSDGGQVTRVVISLNDQLAYAYRGDELIGVSTISSGTKNYPTPTGVFPILEKKRLHRSIRYDNAPMPYMQRLDDYGIAMHAGNLPGYPASHGCIRLPPRFAAWLFAATEIGTEVMIGARVRRADAGGEDLPSRS
jgi:lipoprotein-anchoring transpeptidase ErfK/SrfK